MWKCGGRWSNFVLFQSIFLEDKVSVVHVCMYACIIYIIFLSLRTSEEVMSFLFTSFLFQIAFVFLSSEIPGKFIKVIPYQNSGAIVTIM